VAELADHHLDHLGGFGTFHGRLAGAVQFANGADRSRQPDPGSALDVRDEKIYLTEPLLPATFTRQPNRLSQSARAGSLRG
jgi:hypothetical protein